MATCITTEYFVGEEPSWTVTIVDADTDDPTDPSTLTFTQTVPGSSTPVVYTYGVDSEVVKDSTGVYTFTAPAVAAVTAGADTGKVLVTAVNGGVTEIVVAYYRAVTP